MTLFELYCKLNIGKVGEMMFIIEDSAYDHNLREEDQYFETENERKKVKFVDGIPYIKNIKLDKLIKFNSIHFQGDNKALMAGALQQMEGYL